MARDGRYVLNGDGVLSPPGTYEAAGTRVVYTRGAGPEETLQATGPTSQELLLQVGGSGQLEAGAGNAGGTPGSVRGEAGAGGGGWVSSSSALRLQVLLREPNPGVHFEFWLPRERYGPFQAQAQALGWPLRQPQPREVESQPAETPVVPEGIAARVASLVPGEEGTSGPGVGMGGSQAGGKAGVTHHTPPRRLLWAMP